LRNPLIFSYIIIYHYQVQIIVFISKYLHYFSLFHISVNNTNYQLILRLNMLTKKIKLICNFCGKEYELSESSYRAEKHKHPNKQWFCSSTCAYQGLRKLKRVKTFCTLCKKDLEMDEHAFARRKEHFCDNKCYRSYQKIPLEQRREMIDLICSQCGVSFRIFKRSYDKQKRYGSKNSYCSIKCQAEARRNDYSKSFTVKCDNCNKDIIRTGRQLKASKFHFCTPSCKGTYFARIYALGEQRSQLELKIEKYIKQYYSNLEYIPNDRKILHGLELDFYFPTLGFAIEINGPAHFTPIYGDESLFITQKHDIIKKILCKKKNIRLLEITDTLNYNKDNSLEIFDKYIKPIIDILIIM